MTVVSNCAADIDHDLSSLHGVDDHVVAFALGAHWRKRVGRTRWLIDQQMGQWLPELAGAPRSWVNTYSDGQPDGIGFHFACSLAKAVPGRTWLEVKLDVADGAVRFGDELRRRCVTDFLRGLVHLEQRDIVHGDLSPNNIIVNIEAAAGEPVRYLIDFDGFVAPAAGRDLYRLSAAEGGTFGTKGYCPPDLERKCSNNDLSVAPYSDRYARDMILLELLCYDDPCDFEEPVCQWPVQQVRFGLERHPLSDEFAYLSRARDLHASRKAPAFDGKSGQGISDSTSAASKAGAGLGNGISRV